MFILFIIIVFSLLGILFLRENHRQYKIGIAIADFCYTIGTGKDPEDDK